MYDMASSYLRIDGEGLLLVFDAIGQRLLSISLSDRPSACSSPPVSQAWSGPDFLRRTHAVCVAGLHDPASEIRAVGLRLFWQRVVGFFVFRIDADDLFVPLFRLLARGSPAESGLVLSLPTGEIKRLAIDCVASRLFGSSFSTAVNNRPWPSARYSCYPGYRCQCTYRCMLKPVAR